jgi:hypothetical protein
MSKLYLSHVGDGLCLGLRSPYHEYLQMDCGNDRLAKIGAEGWWRAIYRIYCGCQRDTKFILSHFHADHYNGLIYAAKNHPFLPSDYKIGKLYYHGKPIVPGNTDFYTKFYQAIFALNMYKLLIDPTLFPSTSLKKNLGDGSGLMELDLLNAANKINGSIEWPETFPLFRGSKFNHDGREFECLWPPKIYNDADFSASIKEALISFNQALEKHPLLRRLYEHVNEEPMFREFKGSSEVTDLPADDALPGLIERTPDDERTRLAESPKKSEGTGFTGVLKEANRKLRNAANRLSLVLKYENELLLCGDLEGKQLGIVIKSLVDSSKNDFKIMAAPHHGTKWRPEMSNLSARFTLAADGSRLHSHLKSNELGTISKRFLSTYDLGDIYLKNHYR